MITATWNIALTLALSSASATLCCRHDKEVGECVVCVAEKLEIARLIGELQTCPNWRTRDRAARALHKFNWKCHPEVVAALAGALLQDCEEEVREEAARSLWKMKPCLPEAHLALARAARCDSDWATRLWAKLGLRALKRRRCIKKCKVCGPPSGPGLGNLLVFPVPQGRLRLLPLPKGQFLEPIPGELEPLKSPASTPAQDSVLPSDIVPLPPGPASSTSPGSSPRSSLRPLPLPPQFPEATDLPPPLEEPLIPTSASTSRRNPAARPSAELAAIPGPAAVLTGPVFPGFEPLPLISVAPLAGFYPPLMETETGAPVVAPVPVPFDRQQHIP